MATRVMQLIKNEKGNIEIVQGIYFDATKKIIQLGNYAQLLPRCNQESTNIELLYSFGRYKQDNISVIELYNNVSSRNFLLQESRIMLIVNKMEGVKFISLCGKGKTIAEGENEGIYILNPKDEIYIEIGNLEKWFSAVEIDREMYLVEKY